MHTLQILLAAIYFLLTKLDVLVPKGLSLCLAFPSADTMPIHAEVTLCVTAGL